MYIVGVRRAPLRDAGPRADGGHLRTARPSHAGFGGVGVIRRKVFFAARTITRALPEAYQPDVKGRFVWLQRLAHRVLKRWGKGITVQDQVVKEVTLPSAKTILDQIREEIRARVGFSALKHEDLVIVAGPAGHYEISLVLADVAHFQLGRGPDRPPEVFGVPIYVTSWMEGWIVLPRKVLNARAEREQVAGDFCGSTF